MAAHKSEVAVFWDLESCPLTRKGDVGAAVQRLRGAASQYGTVTHIAAYLAHEMPSSEQAARKDRLSGLSRSKLPSFNVQLEYCQRYGQTEVVDRRIITDIPFYLKKHPDTAVIVLITDDGDFINIGERLQLYEICVVVISSTVSFRRYQRFFGDVYHWKDDILSQAGTPWQTSSGSRGSSGSYAEESGEGGWNGEEGEEESYEEGVWDGEEDEDDGYEEGDIGCQDGYEDEDSDDDATMSIPSRHPQKEMDCSSSSSGTSSSDSDSESSSSESDSSDSDMEVSSDSEQERGRTNGPPRRSARTGESSSDSGSDMDIGSTSACASTMPGRSQSTKSRRSPQPRTSVEGDTGIKIYGRRAQGVASSKEEERRNGGMASDSDSSSDSEEEVTKMVHSKRRRSNLVSSADRKPGSAEFQGAGSPSGDARADPRPLAPKMQGVLKGVGGGAVRGGVFCAESLREETQRFSTPVPGPSSHAALPPRYLPKRHQQTTPCASHSRSRFHRIALQGRAQQQGSKLEALGRTAGIRRKRRRVGEDVHDIQVGTVPSGSCRRDSWVEEEGTPRSRA
ncbi:hypothetical protein NMY22_g4432 [Coprinellus aureogranulatus]|nr:hypothetical protein NMY22_g4432 [Coprinellus aureogranulatus]